MSDELQDMQRIASDLQLELSDVLTENKRLRDLADGSTFAEWNAEVDQMTTDNKRLRIEGRDKADEITRLRDAIRCAGFQVIRVPSGCILSKIGD